MWIALNDAVWEAKIPPTVKLVALCLATYFNNAKDTAFPSETTLARRTGLSKRTVIRNLQWLAKNQMIRVTQLVKEGGKWPVNHYVFLKGLVTPCQLVTPCHLPSDTMPPCGDKVPSTGDTVSKVGDMVSHYSSIDSSKESSNDSDFPF